MRQVFVVSLAALFMAAATLVVPAAYAQDDQAAVEQLRSNVSRMQLDLVNLQEDVDDLLAGRGALEERLTQRLTEVSETNAQLREQVETLTRRAEALEDQLAEYRRRSASNAVAELNNIVISVLMDRLNEEGRAEPLLLEVINEGEAAELPKDLLLFYLARVKRQQGAAREAVGYLSTVVSDYPDSPYVPRSVWEISQILGDLGQTEDQIALLRQLINADPDGEYGQRAEEQLEELGAEPSGSGSGTSS